MDEIKTNIIAGVSILNKSNIEQLIRESERLEVIAEYVKNSKYIDRETLLILLGFEPKENTNNQ